MCNWEKTIKMMRIFYGLIKVRGINGYVVVKGNKKHSGGFDWTKEARIKRIVQMPNYAFTSILKFVHLPQSTNIFFLHKTTKTI